MAKVDLKPAHRELQKLARRLRRFDRRHVGKLLPPKPGRAVSVTAFNWVSGLERTVTDIESWCESNSPDDPFTIDVPPRTTARRRTAGARTRRT